MVPVLDSAFVYIQVCPWFWQDLYEHWATIAMHNTCTSYVDSSLTVTNVYVFPSQLMNHQLPDPFRIPSYICYCFVIRNSLVYHEHVEN